MTATRGQFVTRRIRVVGEAQRLTAQSLIQNMPVDPVKPLEIVVREEVRARTLDQNARMWAGPLKDIEEQAWVAGQQFNALVWHEHFKELYLPDESQLTIEDLERHVKSPATYRKYGHTPAGKRILVGSTTELTKYGFMEYMEQVLANGAGMGVQFSAGPRE